VTQQPSIGAASKQRALREAIQRLIVERGLAPGDALPTEPELAAQLGVSRHPLREAMKALQAIGIVDVRHGYGSYVGSAALAGLEAGLSFRGTLSARGDLSDLRDLLEMRELLESGLVGRVLAAHDEIDFAGLEAAVASMEDEAALGRYAPDHDWSFHERLYRPLGNRMVLELLEVFWRVFRTVDPMLPQPGESPAETAALHRRILDALRTGEAGTVQRAIDQHFRAIRGRIA
jgi:DNA-binding FadR family transcriptional regulator